MDIEAPIEASGQVSVGSFVASLNESLTEPKKKGSKKSKGSYCVAINCQIMLHGSKSGQCRYAITDKMMAISTFYQSRQAYCLLSKLFALPSKRTLQRSLQNTNVMPGFNVAMPLGMKLSTMHEKDRCVALVFNEMSLKTTLVYNHGLDKIEGFEDFWLMGYSHFLADHALAFMV